MFNTISWQAYWTSLAIASLLYYLLILLVYYRNDLIGRLTRQPGFSRSGPRAMGTFTRSGDQSFILNDSEFEAPSSDSEEGIVYTCMDELNAFFAEAKKRKWNKTEMIYSLQLIMKKYPSIAASGYKQSVSNVLMNQCEHICNLHLSAEELNHVWLG